MWHAADSDHFDRPNDAAPCVQTFRLIGNEFTCAGCLYLCRWCNILRMDDVDVFLTVAPSSTLIMAQTKIGIKIFYYIEIFSKFSFTKIEARAAIHEFSSCSMVNGIENSIQNPPKEFSSNKLWMKRQYFPPAQYTTVLNQTKYEK